MSDQKEPAGREKRKKEKDQILADCQWHFHNRAVSFSHPSARIRGAVYRPGEKQPQHQSPSCDAPHLGQEHESRIPQVPLNSPS